MIESYIYVFVREDLSPEQKIVQVGHACWEARHMFPYDGPTSSLVLLSARDKRELLNISKELEEIGIEHYTFFEPDNGMGYSAICTQVVASEIERNVFRRWELYRHTV